MSFMCGRHGRRGDKQRIAEAFHVKVDTADFAEDGDARPDTAATSKFWKEKFAEKRCIIPASSFFEWQGEKGSNTNMRCRSSPQVFRDGWRLGSMEELEDREMGRYRKFAALPETTNGMAPGSRVGLYRQLGSEKIDH